MFESINEAFSRQSEIFDRYEEKNEILQYMRNLTHQHLMRYLRKSDKILELNCGTGIDAVFLGTQGFRIHCIDISAGMINKLKEKINNFNLAELISYQHISFTDLEKLNTNSFNYIFSNFGGLNCAPDMRLIFSQFKQVLISGGRVTLVIMPPVCPWEIALFIKGKFKTAFRRFNKDGISANIEGIRFKTFYYSVKDVIKALGTDFKILDIQGLASLSPPPYMENFPRRYPRLYHILTMIDEKFSHIFPFNRFADHFIITAELIT